MEMPRNQLRHPLHAVLWDPSARHEDVAHRSVELSVPVRRKQGLRVGAHACRHTSPTLSDGPVAHHESPRGDSGDDEGGTEALGPDPGGRRLFHPIPTARRQWLRTIEGPPHQTEECWPGAT